MNKVSATFIVVLIMILFFVIAGNNSMKIGKYENTDNWPIEYQALAEQCKVRDSYNCCISSVKYMLDNNYSKAVDQKCKPGFDTGMMKCIDSIIWCEPRASCPEGDIRCECAITSEEDNCNSNSECTWTNYHSNTYYCMEKFCADYTKDECTSHSRCKWVVDRQAGYEYCDVSN